VGVINCQYAIGNFQKREFMIKKLLKHSGFLLLIVCCLLSVCSNAQTIERQKVAIFAPLFIDSAFAGSTYKYDKAFPKFLNPGVEFYQGVQWALDSLQKKGAPLEVFIYDSRSAKIPLAQRFTGAELKDVQMVIAHANAADVRIIATEAQRRKIPFISATFPNDAGITNNPYMVVLNSTLRTHCEGIYQYLQKYHSQDRIILFRRNGAQEGLLRDYFNEAAKPVLVLP
jgi:hypothetical protein